MPARTGISALTVLIVARPEDQSTIQDGLPAECNVTVIDTLSYEAMFNEIILVGADLVIVASQQANSKDISTLEKLIDEHHLPVIWFVEEDKQSFAPDAIRIGVTSFVVDGLQQNRIASLLMVALERYKRVSELEGELQKSKESLAARKIVERAKGFLMEKRGLSEQEAYQTLRSTAMRQGKSLKSVCEAIISMSDLLP